MPARRRYPQFLSSLRCALLVALLLGALCLLPLPLAAQGDGPMPHTIHVSGSGAVFGAPDVAHIEIGFEINDEDLSAAFAETGETMLAIRDAAIALGVAREDIQTRGLSLWVDERYESAAYEIASDEPPEPRRIYRLSNAFRFIIRDLELVTEVIDASIAAGANNIYGLSYAIADTRALEDEARARAVTDANERAAKLAALFGKAVGEAIQISESSGANFGGFRAEASMADMGAGGGGPIEAGQLSVNVSVSATYILLPAAADE